MPLHTRKKGYALKVWNNSSRRTKTKIPQQRVKIGHFKKVEGIRSPKEPLTLPSVEAHFGNSARCVKIPGNHVSLGCMAIPSLLSALRSGSIISILHHNTVLNTLSVLKTEELYCKELVTQVMVLLRNQTGESEATQKLTKVGGHSLCWRNKRWRQYHQNPENAVTQQKLESLQPVQQELQSYSHRLCKCCAATYTNRTEEYPGYSLLLPFNLPPFLPMAQTQWMYEPEKSSLLGSASLRCKAVLRKGEE